MRKNFMNIVSMRKSLLAVVAIICCAMAATVFTSCSKSSDDDNGSGSDAKPAGAKYSLSLTESEDILKYCDVSVTYNDGTLEKTEKLTSTTWSKTLTANKLPATISFKETFTLKADVDTTSSATVKYVREYRASYCLINESGNELSTGGGSTNPTSKTYKISQLAVLVTSGRCDRNLILSVDADGKVTENGAAK